MAFVGRNVISDNVQAVIKGVASGDLVCRTGFNKVRVALTYRGIEQYKGHRRDGDSGVRLERRP